MKLLFSPFLLIYLYLPFTLCLFTSTPSHNYTIANFTQITGNSAVVLNGPGTKFLLWTRLSPSRLEIYSIEGTLLCSLNSILYFSDFIWPPGLSPIVSDLTTENISQIDETTCELKPLFNLANVTKTPGQIAYNLNYAKKGNSSVLMASTSKSVYTIDFPSGTLLGTFAPGNETSVKNAALSKDFSHIFVLTVSKVNSSEPIKIKVWQHNNQTKPPVNEIALPYSSMPDQKLYNLKESDNCSVSLLMPEKSTTKVFTFDASGTLSAKASRTYGASFTINDGNLFDVVAIQNPTNKSLEIIKLNTGQTLQTLSNLFNDVKQQAGLNYQNRTLILLTKAGNVLTYQYKDDTVVPDGGDGNDGGSDTWWIVLVVILIVAIIAGVGVFFYRKKKAQKSASYGLLSDAV